jgi:hypothetical protein
MVTLDLANRTHLDLAVQVAPEQLSVPDYVGVAGAQHSASDIVCPHHALHQLTVHVHLTRPFAVLR